jgi:hypothetical protein
MPLPALAIPIIGDIVGKIFDRVIPDKAAAQKAKDEFAAQTQAQDFQLAIQQIMVNQEEAKSDNWFVAGWRPAVGWIGAFGLGYAAILEPLIRFLAVVLWGYKGNFPVLDTSLTMQVLFGILGLGAYRAYEKVKGVAR